MTKSVIGKDGNTQVEITGSESYRSFYNDTVILTIDMRVSGKDIEAMLYAEPHKQFYAYTKVQNSTVKAFKRAFGKLVRNGDEQQI